MCWFDTFDVFKLGFDKVTEPNLKTSKITAFRLSLKKAENNLKTKTVKLVH